jgi:hypothetical protein
MVLRAFFNAPSFGIGMWAWSVADDHADARKNFVMGIDLEQIRF